MNTDFEKIRADFPQIHQKVHGRPLVYLDSAATTLKPQSVCTRVSEFLRQESANVHRGAHTLSNQATVQYEECRKNVAQFISARSEEEVIFTKGTTESINLVANSLGETLSEGDEILLTEMEHHSNIVPWQLLCKRKKLKLRVAPVEEDGSINLDKFQSLFNPKTRLASFAYVSNTLGMENPVEQMVEIARANQCLTLIDAAQAMSCIKVDVQKLNCDFLAFSAHKMFGPFGLGILWGKKDLLSSLPPYQGGGSMISSVSLEDSQYLDPPHRFEAGTPNISGVLGFQEALKYLSPLNREDIHRHESHLVQKAYAGLKEIGNVRFIGNPQSQINIISFVLKDIHSGDIGQLLDQQGIALRTGHHCAQPLMKRFGIAGTVRASFSIYNNNEDVDLFLESLKKSKELLS